MMPEVTTTREVNRYQLATESGVGFRHVRDEDGTHRFRVSDADEAALTAALEAHEADPSVQPPEVGDPAVEARQRFRDALTQGRTKPTTAEKVDALYAALLGEGTNAEPDVRPGPPS